MITILGIYSFMLLGFLAKKSFKDIDSKSFVLLSTYFLQPFLTLWGIMLVPLNSNLVLSPLLYLLAVFVSLIFTYMLSISLKDKKERVIATLTPLIGNTGNLGIPLSYMLFGDLGASIATLINLANVFFIYSFGIFFFASGKYDFKNSFRKIIKIPIIWVGIIAILLNFFHIQFNNEVMKILQMGAFASMVIQLIIFGLYVADINLKEITLKLSFITSINKFIVFPLIGYIVLTLFNVDKLYFKAIMIEILTPLAVSNVNLAALFDLYPQKVSFLIILTSFLFIFIFFLLS